MTTNDNPVTSLRASVNGQPAVTVHGRLAWALHALHVAGRAGLTTLEHPAPRWSHYVWKLRGMGFPISTLHESHGGAFAGTHARYALSAPVTITDIARRGDEREAA